MPHYAAEALCFPAVSPSVRPLTPPSCDAISLLSGGISAGTSSHYVSILLKSFSRSEVKGQGHINGGGIHFDGVALMFAG